MIHILLCNEKEFVGLDLGLVITRIPYVYEITL